MIRWASTIEGRAAWEISKSPVPDLVVLDLNLLRKDGCEVLSNIKADPALAKTPVVIFTTSQANSDIARSYTLGAKCYLKKPGNLPEFVAVVQSVAEFWLGLRQYSYFSSKRLLDY